MLLGSFKNSSEYLEPWFLIPPSRFWRQSTPFEIVSSTCSGSSFTFKFGFPPMRYVINGRSCCANSIGRLPGNAQHLLIRVFMMDNVYSNSISSITGRFSKYAIGTKM
ncbi:hypothetical protein OGATHE_006407 [Ogataea polymorpha]|uniref:Uncharacterized protein n=1 Tax=Ogataea polymorpha TaxID=460523 RepID=A0A9P8SWS5_9ASCO|nr:hypothetical protein OGATHE_006407 [Ogataea polymorpha]